MNHPSQQELLEARPLEEWVDQHFLRPDPAAFPEAGFRPIVAAVSRLLDVDANGVFCVGSGAIGLSLNPSKVLDGNLKPFDDRSDIDLAIVSEVHFETAWRDLRRAAQPLLKHEMEADLAKLLSWQRKRLFDGVILANKLLPYLSFGALWLPALVQIGQQVEEAIGRPIEINAWIFRDYWGLRTYITGSILLCRERLI